MIIIDWIKHAIFTYKLNRDYPLTNYSVEDAEDDDWD